MYKVNLENEDVARLWVPLWVIWILVCLDGSGPPVKLPRGLQVAKVQRSRQGRQLLTQSRPGSSFSGLAHLRSRTGRRSSVLGRTGHTLSSIHWASLCAVHGVMLSPRLSTLARTPSLSLHQHTNDNGKNSCGTWNRAIFDRTRKCCGGLKTSPLPMVSPLGIFFWKEESAGPIEE